MIIKCTYSDNGNYIPVVHPFVSRVAHVYVSSHILHVAANWYNNGGDTNHMPIYVVLKQYTTLDPNEHKTACQPTHGIPAFVIFISTWVCI